MQVHIGTAVIMLGADGYFQSFCFEVYTMIEIQLIGLWIHGNKSLDGGIL